MNIPESVRIAGVEYRVQEVERLILGGKEAAGTIDYCACEISINSTLGMSHDMKCMTMLHEIGHAILENAQIETEDVERIVEAYAKGIYQIIQDNEDRLFGKGEQFGKENEDEFSYQSSEEIASVAESAF